MALRGNLRDFSLPDVFQLVTFSRKTGVLRIVREDDAQGSVWFREGEVFFASSNWHSDPLGERLVAAERITPQALKRALEQRSREPEDGRRLGRILIDEGYITESTLESFVSEQIQDTIFDLMRWEEGEFDFEAMPDVVEEDIGLTVSIENVVMEGSRRLEEWGRIKKKIPSTDVVFKMATAPGEGTFEISLKPAEWELLLLIDATRSVAELATATDRTDFDVARVIYGLFSAGLLEFATEDEIDKNRAERAEREARLAEIDAAREAAREKEKRAALDRESKLAEEALRRREEQSLKTAAAEPVAAPEVRRTEPVEEPSFLGSDVSVPSADDQAMLDAFMGAVLEAPPKPESQPKEPEVAPVATEPYVPAEEPAFMSVGHAEEEDLRLIPVPSVEDVLQGIAIEPVAPMGDIDAVAASFVEAEVAESPAAEADVVETAGVTEAAQAEVPGAVEPQDFERELMALGLGEIPSDLLEPLTSEPEAGSAAPGVPEPAFEAPVEPMSEIVTEGLGWPEQPAQATAPDDVAAELAGLVEELGLPGGAPPAPVFDEQPASQPLLSGEEADFSALLESLDIDAEDAQSVVAEPVTRGAAAASPDFVNVTPSGEEPQGFDADLFIDDEVTTGAISTDAFLEDIGIDDLGFSGGMTDELSALTGAERRQPARPQASVNAIPDAGSVLQRDARVEKDTVLKIIDGIKNL